MAPRGSVNTMYRPLKGYDSTTDRNSLWNYGEGAKNASKRLNNSKFVAPRLTLQQKLLASKRNKAVLNLVSLDRVDDFDEVRKALTAKN